jgi:hypothetical protein
VHHLQHQRQAEKNNYIASHFHKNHPANLLNICFDCHQKIHQTGLEHKVVKTTQGYTLQSLSDTATPDTAKPDTAKPDTAKPKKLYKNK